MPRSKPEGKFKHICKGFLSRQSPSDCLTQTEAVGEWVRMNTFVLQGSLLMSLTLLHLHLSRRCLETHFMMKYPKGSHMHAIAYAFGLMWGAANLLPIIYALREAYRTSLMSRWKDLQLLDRYYIVLPLTCLPPAAFEADLFGAKFHNNRIPESISFRRPDLVQKLVTLSYIWINRVIPMSSWVVLDLTAYHKAAIIKVEWTSSFGLRLGDPIELMPTSESLFEGFSMLQGAVVFLSGNLVQYQSHRTLANLSKTKGRGDHAKSQTYGLPKGKS